ncbi:MAG: hypoxanthine phosphoribosyltransferase [Acidobacteriia bacterium]|nr:hypoxanthine phosphoribosyltransferase [Terriglobia bacterium]
MHTVLSIVPKASIEKGGCVAVDWYRHLNEALGPILFEAETIQNRVAELGRQITADYDGRTPHLIGVLKGATVFHADLIRAIGVGLSFDFMAVASYGTGIKSSGEVRILKDLDESVDGKDVLLVEDILDTGLTLHYLLENLQSRNPRSLRVVTLLSKPSRRQIAVHADYVGFEVPNKFVVGYGLDFNQRYRNLPYICELILPPGTIADL